MGVPADWASATVRFSIGPHIRDEDCDEIAARIRQVINHQRALRGWTPGKNSGQVMQKGVPV
jgi:cysteine sulfinate desulfinase/cysteine desulfurase-like protein